MAHTPTIRPEREKVARELRLLEERLRHELLEDTERQELRDQVLRLRREIALPE
jgi:archaellum component FlaC